MAKKALYKKLLKEIKSNSRKLTLPWSLLPEQNIPYDASLHSYALRGNTLPTRVRLYGPIMTAVTMLLNPDNPYYPCPFRMIEKRGLGGSFITVVEAQMPDGTSMIIEASDKDLKASTYESDGTHGPTAAFKDMDDATIALFVLALMNEVRNVDIQNGNGKIESSLNDLRQAVGNSYASPWTDANDIPDYAKEAAYFLDAVYVVLSEKMDINCGSDTSDTPDELGYSFFNSPSSQTGKLIAEYLANGAWTPLVLKTNGKAGPRSNAGLTIADAKGIYSVYSAHRNWTAGEKALIPSFPEDMPVMPEVIRMANRIVNTRNDVNPVVNLMWRGETGFGKSTGMRQLACVLNAPFLTQTCHPGMEAADLKSSFVPAGDSEDHGEENPLIPSHEEPVSVPGTAEVSFEWALHHLFTLEQSERTAFLEDREGFYIQAEMDQEKAEMSLFGTVLNADLSEICRIYTEVCLYIQQQQFAKKLEAMESLVNSAGHEQKKDNGPQFLHIVSPYMEAMQKGYIVEIQEASRIRDSGVLVSINEFDRPGAMMSLANGKRAVRHKDAICVVTDNVGYASCRPIDPSVLRRMGMIIDSYDLSEDMLKDRVRRNTGVTDKNLLDTAYKLWLCVRETCAQNSITEGSVSPMELERFVQAVKYDGLDSISVNLDDCIISKATSSIEDQKVIRTNCQAIYGTK